MSCARPPSPPEVKLLLTSAGVQNASIRDALVDLLGKPLDEATALVVPTAAYGHPLALPGPAYRFITGRNSRTPLCELGWRSLGLLELTALPSIDEKNWRPMVEAADALLVSGGDSLYLAHWMRESGLAGLLPSLGSVWASISAGSMAMAPRIGEHFKYWSPPAGGDEALGIVGFSIFPHLDHPDLPENTMADAERWAASLPNPAYAIDDDTAIRVVDDNVDVVSEGSWRLFTPPAAR
jgi:dipeptidase E